MRKKFWIGLSTVILAMGIGTAVYAAGDETSHLKDMLPFMKEMHPNMSEDQLLDMHQSGDMSKMMQGADMSKMMQSI
ncbi:hypothetical protein CA600_28585 [Paenibacillus sp. VTT E-133280]|uniref:hypothetical protein n=1 Tax=unclassified Paenibacillus TaxID=185978 RepID=UPI000B9FCB54|nr:MULTISPECIES: hypothetical protein [unclassified Paenibacillus]MBY3621376.1 hypothetical protein [Acinetobacter sp. CUI P1]MDH6373014.1 hypothetical protein [Paenibacillus sp. PastF-3]OZQ60350.1 hypothetical protein CA600_28585 [Paenibacillus sp. VTT E-133280]OZQ85099.1 hypothetical protein CA598_21935 [Paenibacillus sp. VTT E-133291]